MHSTEFYRLFWAHETLSVAKRRGGSQHTKGSVSWHVSRQKSSLFFPIFLKQRRSIVSFKNFWLNFAESRLLPPFYWIGSRFACRRRQLIIRLSTRFPPVTPWPISTNKKQKKVMATKIILRLLRDAVHRARRHLLSARLCHRSWARSDTNVHPAPRVSHLDRSLLRTLLGVLSLATTL